jgi:hypothetical protein
VFVLTGFHQERCKNPNFLYFRTVNPKTTIKQKLIAACLLAVFLVITVVKLLHSHEALGGSHYSLGIEQIEKNSDCSICDYHFTKDTDYSVVVFATKSPEFISVTSICYESRITSSIGFSYADRGPPAFA